MINPVDLDENLVHDIVANKLKVWVSNPVRHVLFLAGEVVVHDNHLVAHEHEPVHQVGSHESCASCHKHALLVLRGKLAHGRVPRGQTLPFSQHIRVGDIAKVKLYAD